MDWIEAHMPIAGQSMTHFRDPDREVVGDAAVDAQDDHGATASARKAMIAKPATSHHKVQRNGLKTFRP